MPRETLVVVPVVGNVESGVTLTLSKDRTYDSGLYTGARIHVLHWLLRTTEPLILMRISLEVAAIDRTSKDKGWGGEWAKFWQERIDGKGGKLGNI